MTDLIDTTEMYLRTILELEEENIVPLRARISERLGHSGPTVSQTVGRMERDGLVVVSGDRHLELTDDGRRKAVHVMRKHRLAERLLSDVIGLEWEYVHEEACRWEHVMSEQVERKLLDDARPPHRVALRQPDPRARRARRRGRDPASPSGVVNLVDLVHGADRGRRPDHPSPRRAGPGRPRAAAAAQAGRRCSGQHGHVLAGRLLRPRPGRRLRARASNCRTSSRRTSSSESDLEAPSLSARWSRPDSWPGQSDR